MKKRLNKYIAVLDYAHRNLFVLSGVSSDVSFCSFAIANGASPGLAYASISLVFLAGNGVLKMNLETIKDKETNKEELFCWVMANLIA